MWSHLFLTWTWNFETNMMPDCMCETLDSTTKRPRWCLESIVVTIRSVLRARQPSMNMSTRSLCSFTFGLSLRCQVGKGLSYKRGAERLRIYNSYFFTSRKKNQYLHISILKRARRPFPFGSFLRHRHKERTALLSIYFLILRDPRHHTQLTNLYGGDSEQGGQMDERVHVCGYYGQF